MFGSKDLLFSSEKYGVAKSLRFRSSASAYLSRTPASAGNRKTWTWSGWLKRGVLTDVTLLSANPNSGYDNTSIAFGYGTTGDIGFASSSGGTTQIRCNSSALLRDPSAWYHLVVAVDTTQATNSNGVKIWLNGAQLTLTFSSYTQNTDTSINATLAHSIGRLVTSTGGAGSYLDGYLAEVNFIDGQALAASSFGFYDNNGIWQPAGYTGTYGTNGFYLKFTDVGATSGANSGYGKDFSGFNTNYWTTNNFGTTSTATTYDSMYDSPVNASNGITGIGNYCVMNPLQLNKATLSNGNLTYVAGSGATDNYICASTLGLSSGKFYWEVTVTSLTTYLGIGVASITNIGSLVINNSPVGAGSTSYCVYQDGSKGNNNTTSSYQTGGYATGNVVGVAFDIDNGKIWFSKNGTFPNSGDPAAGTNAAYTSIAANTFLPALSGNTCTLTPNFGQQPFAYTPPSGFSAVNTQNLSTPTITNGAAYMAAVTYTGTGSSQTITASSTNSGNNPNGTTFQPDLVWVKGRSGATDHAWYDAVRGVQLQLESNTTGAETTETTGLTAFTSSGFTTGALAQMNTNTATYVAWEWIAGGAPTTDNVAGAGNVPTAGSVKINGANSTSTLAGSIAATRLSANTSAGFSVVTYTGTGANATVGHGLGVAPSMVIVKRRNAAAYWPVYFASLGATKNLNLNLSDAQANDGAALWNSSSPDTTKFNLGTSGDTNANGSTYVAYCFAPVSDYSAFGSYTGNGSADGPFVYTGFRPRFILWKISSGATNDWGIVDTSRSPYNVSNLELYPNLSIVEGSYQSMDILSNGFKIRSSGNFNNGSTYTYIYAAFAENPFKISRAR